MTLQKVEAFGPTQKNTRRTVGAGSYGVVAVVRVEGGARRDAEVEGRFHCERTFERTFGAIAWDQVILTHTHLSVQCVTELRIDPS